MHRSSFDKMRAFRDAYLGTLSDRSLSILDVGSAAVAEDAGSYRGLFALPPWTYRGLDLAPGPNVDIVPQDPYDWAEIPDGSVDVVVSGQAFEHIEWPWLTMTEIARVLRTNGIAAVTAPSSGPVHRFPKDCWRYYPDGFPALAAYAGLRVVEAHWDNRYAYPENAMWGDAFVVLQRPERSADEETAWARRRRAAKASAGVALSPEPPAASHRAEPSPIPPATSRDAIGRREAEVLRQLAPLGVKARLLWNELQRMKFVLRSPLDRLTRS